MNRKIFSIGGPCGVGKDTIVHELLKQFPGKFIRLPRTTTRSPRRNEYHGDEYFFVSFSEFQSRCRAGKIVAVDEARSGFYGIDIEHITSMINNGFQETFLMVGGICGIKLKEHLHRIVNIYITADVREIFSRLERRGHEMKDLENRRAWVLRQLQEEPPLFDFVVENHDQGLKNALTDVLRIMRLSE